MPGNRTRGQRAGLTRSAILEAALALADREGLKALSMRRLGAELGVEAMTLYHHVPGKDALLDGLVEQLLTRVAPPVFESGSWRDGLRGYADALLAALLAHPHLIPLVVTRPAVTPANLRAMESGLAFLRGAGFPPATALDMLYAVIGFVVGHAAIQVSSGPAGEFGQERLLDGLDPAEFPLLAGAVRDGREPRSRFGFALEAMLSGFEPARETDHRPV
ncbi:TetR/AcrR family transcriptional regulator [Nonomuraea sp. NPDC048826]|uniref:TetR/AcrR family transcriptional regulator n=1 Tax=Nonomuraea sp. NPDC048826 TaxID=3364347 RepID=UPI003721399F